MLDVPHYRVTDEIELHPLELAHAEARFQLVIANRKYLRQWMPWVDGVREIADAKAVIEQNIEQRRNDVAYQLGIWFRGQLCGAIGLHAINWPNRFVSLGYWLDAGHQGRGIMTACCRAVVDHAFDGLRLNRVIIRCAVENRRSRAIPERLGFTLEGILRDGEWLYDHYVDLASYAQLSRERSRGA